MGALVHECHRAESQMSCSAGQSTLHNRQKLRRMKLESNKNDKSLGRRHSQIQRRDLGWDTALDSMLRLNLKEIKLPNSWISFKDTLSWNLYSLLRNCFKSCQVHTTTKYCFHQSSHAWWSSHMLLSSTEAAKLKGYKMPNPSKQITVL